ncbi:MAG: ABC transporter permease subunit [Saprospiraceae bacterium]|nr:ABC transporter permease subunit [Saprospiraceae bacterium]
MNRISNILRSYTAYIRRRTTVAISLHIFFITLFFLKLIVGNSPYYVYYKGESCFLLWKDIPEDGTELKSELFLQQYNWENVQADVMFFPIFYQGSQKFYSTQEWKRPLSTDEDRFHLLGTYDLGRDLFISCLQGLQKSLIIAFLSILIAILIGLPLGVAMPFYNYRKYRLSPSAFVVLVLSFLVLFYILLLSFELRSFSFFAFFAASLIISLIFIPMTKNARMGIRVNTDQILVNGIVLFKSVPMLMVLLLLLQFISKPTVISLSVIIGLYLSISFAKYSRFLSFYLIQEKYIQSLISLGIPDNRIIIRHLIPEIFRRLFQYISLSLASIILAEASISFLGLGLPLDDISLGSIMHTSRSNPSAWWVVVFPGLCVFWLVYTFQILYSESAEREIF